MKVVTLLLVSNQSAWFLCYDVLVQSLTTALDSTFMFMHEVLVATNRVSSVIVTIVESR